MRILFVMLAPPAPANAGHRIRNQTLLQALAREGHRVSLICYAKPAEISHPAPDLADLCDDFLLVPEPESRMTGRVRALFSRRPYGAMRLESEAMQAAVAQRLAREEFDAILCDDIYMLANLPVNGTLPVLLNKHDLTWRIMDQFARAERNLLKKVYCRLEGRKIRKLETDACRLAKAVLVCSACDKELLLRDCPQATAFVVPNVIDVDRYTPADDDDGRTVLFVGAMDWVPNQDAVAFFVEDILPHLRQLEPEVRFVAAGRNPPSSLLQRYASVEGVQFTGTISDMRPVIARAAVCVVPLRLGSGTRLKILEAGAMAKVVVSTTLGAEGLDFVAGEEILVADEPVSFKMSVASALKNAETRTCQGRAARKRVERDYSIAALQVSLSTALDNVIEGHR